MAQVLRKRVIIESPFKAETPEFQLKNMFYRQECIRDSISRGEAPFASHQMYTAALDDNDPHQRLVGIACGHTWWYVAELIVFYIDLGFSPGMEKALERCHVLQFAIEKRSIHDNNKHE